MKRSLLLPLACLILLGCSQAAPPVSNQTDKSPLGWLNGCWMTADYKTHERWDVADAQHAFGSNYALEDGVVSFFEHMRIEPSAEGLTFQAYPAGKGPSGFPMIEQGETRITFANTEHDYPQKISYQGSPGKLTATISLIDGDNPVTWEFWPCPL